MGAENIVADNIGWVDGQDNIGSVQTTVYYAPVSAFADGGIPEIPASPTAYAASVTISTDFTFNAGEGWRSMYVTEDTGMVECESVGEIDGKSFKNRFSYFHPGGNAAALGFMRWCNNTNTIWLVPEADGKHRIIGSEDLPAHVTEARYATEETTEGRRGFRQVVQASAVSPAPYYTGSIVEYTSPSGS